MLEYEEQPTQMKHKTKVFKIDPALDNEPQLDLSLITRKNHLGDLISHFDINKREDPRFTFLQLYGILGAGFYCVKRQATD